MQWVLTLDGLIIIDQFDNIFFWGPYEVQVKRRDSPYEVQIKRRDGPYEVQIKRRDGPYV